MALAGMGFLIKFHFENNSSLFQAIEFEEKVRVGK